MSDRNAPSLRQRPQKCDERTPEHEQRRGHDHQHLVLRHVRGEEDAAERVERGDERDDESDPPGGEGGDLPRPDAFHSCDADGVHRAGDGQRQDDERFP